MDVGNRVWQVLAILVTMFSAILSAYVAYDLFAKGPTAEKRIELRAGSAINPLSDLAALGDKVTLSLRLEDEIIDNLAVVNGFFRNTGSSPILPADYHENISISTEKPWKIVSVANSEPGLQVRWKKIGDTRFEAEPMLLNPGDMVIVYIYITNTQFDKNSNKRDAPSPSVKWNAHITNLRGFDTSPSMLTSNRNRWIFIDLTNWAVIFMIVAAMLFEALYLHFLSRCDLLSAVTLSVIFLILGASLFSFAAAESISTYLFGNFFTSLFGISHWMNMPWIILYVIMLLYLYRRAQVISSAKIRATSIR